MSFVRNAWLVCGLTLLSSSGALAKDTANPQQQWDKYFGARDFRDPVRDVARFLKVPQACKNSVNQVVDQVAIYGDDLQGSRENPKLGVKAEQVFQQTKDTLTAEMKADDPCAKISLQAYYLASAAQLQLQTGKEFSYIAPSRLGPALVGVYLANRGNLTIAVGSRPRFYTQPKEGLPPKMRGDYSCDESRIRLFADPDLKDLPRPYDAGAAFSLEEDHLLRDKNTPYNSVKKHYAGDWNSYLLDDETLALIWIASLQYHAKNGSDGRNDTAIASNQDFSTLAPGSNFDRIGRKAANWDDPSHAIFPEANGDYGKSLRHENEEYVQKIFDYSALVYFGMAALDGRFDCHQPIPPAEEYSGSNYDKIREPLFPNYYWGTPTEEGVLAPIVLAPIPHASDKPRNRSLKPRESKFYLKNHLTDPSFSSGDFFKELEAAPYRKVNVGPFLDSLNQLDEKMAKPSQTCLQLDQAIQKGQVNGYAGVPGNTKPGGDGTKPGGDGTKPGGDGTKPGGDGTKPGGDGTQP